VDGNVFEAWKERQAEEERRRQQKKALQTGGGPDNMRKGMNGSPGVSPDGSAEDEYSGNGKGKGKDLSPRLEQDVRSFGGGGEDGDRADPTGENEGLRNGASGGSRSPGFPGQLSPREGGRPVLGPLVVLACRHIYHQSCLEELQAKEGLTQGSSRHHAKDAEYRCPIDG